MPLELRDYQEEAVRRTLKAFTTMQAPLLVLATGAGKTVIFSEVIRRFGKRTLVLAHRDELLKQAASKISDVYPGASIGFIKGRQCENDKQIIISSVQTIVKRLKYLPSDIDLVVVDEAHHSSANSYQKIFQYLRVREYDGPKLLGVTATPNRSDKKQLGDTFEAIIYEKNMLDLIKEKHLVNIKGLRVDTKINLDNVRTIRGDFDEKELAKIINTPARNKLVVDTYFKYARDRAVIVFAVDLRHARELMNAFITRGIVAAVVDGTMKMPEREAIIKDFAEGKLNVLINVQVLTEGTDIPRCDSVFMCRPTMSSALYIQAVGRGVRLYPTKKDCLVVDFVDNSSRHTLIQTPMLLKEIPEEEIPKERKEQELSEDGLAEGEQEEFDLWEALMSAEADSDIGRLGLVPSRSEYTWNPLYDVKGFALDYGDKNALLLLPRDLHGEKWVVYNVVGERLSEIIAEFASLETAQGQAEQWIERNKATGKVNMAFVRKTARWRQEPASPEQIASLKRQGHVVPATKGEASDIISRWNMSRLAKKLIEQLSG